MGFGVKGWDLGPTIGIFAVGLGFGVTYRDSGFQRVGILGSRVGIWVQLSGFGVKEWDLGSPIVILGSPIGIWVQLSGFSLWGWDSGPTRGLWASWLHSQTARPVGRHPAEPRAAVDGAREAGAAVGDAEEAVVHAVRAVIRAEIRRRLLAAQL